MNSDTLHILYTEHHRQNTARREKIHGITERTVSVLVIIGGWLLISDTPLSESLRWVLVFQVLLQRLHEQQIFPVGLRSACLEHREAGLDF